MRMDDKRLEFAAYAMLAFSVAVLLAAAADLVDRLV